MGLMPCLKSGSIKFEVLGLVEEFEVEEVKTISNLVFHYNQIIAVRGKGNACFQ
jgi:hypothetical protein